MTSLDGVSRRAVTPASPLTAAWGRPAITLRCGLPVPVHPESQLALCLSPSGSCAGGVAWYQDAIDQDLFSTRTPPVIEVHIPTAKYGVSDVLGPITDLLLAAKR